MDFRNNVIYNWHHRTADGGVTSINMVNNYYKPGAATQSGLRRRIVKVEQPVGKYYVALNYVEGYPEISADSWNGGVDRDWDFDLSIVRSDKPIAVPPVITHSPEEAYELVLRYAGAVLPNRDSVDEWVIREVRAGKPENTQYGVVNSQADVGGYPELGSLAAPTDTDRDGMPDAWEKENGIRSHGRGRRRGRCRWRRIREFRGVPKRTRGACVPRWAPRGVVRKTR